MGPRRQAVAAAGLRRRDVLETLMLVAALPVPAVSAPAGSWRLKAATSSFLLWQMDVQQACQAIAKLGFEAVDIWSAFQHCTHLEESKMRFASKGGLKGMLDPAKLRLAAATVYWTGVQPFAPFLGDAGGAVVIRNSVYDTVGSLTAKMRAFLESLKPDLELAEKHNLRIAIENHSGPMLLNNVDTLKAFADLNQSARLGIALAPFHIQNNRETVEDAVRACGRQLFFFYAWQVGELTDFSQLPGFGPADMTPWLAALAEIRYDGYVDVFMHGDREPQQMQAALAKSLTYLRDCESRIHGTR